MWNKQRMKIFFRGVAVLSAAVITAQVCSSCGWMAGEIKDEEVTDLESQMRAEKRTTVFEQSLIDFGVLLRAYNVPRMAVQSKNIGNMTAEKNLPSDIYAMIAATMNKIGPQIVFIPYDAQYVMSESNTGGTITRMYPNIVLDGGITGFDKDMFEKEREVEASGGWAGAQGGGHINAGANYSRLTLDLNLLDYRTQSYFPGALSSNSILLQQSKLGWGVYGYYMGNGGSFDYDLKKKQGVHAALRTLVEYSILEVLGKYFQVPYWRCVRGANPDEDFIKRVYTAFLELQKDQQQLKIKNLLFLHGFNGIDRSAPEFSGPEEGAMKEAMRRTSTSTMSDLYIALWKTVPVDTAARRVLIDRRRQAQEDRIKAEDARKVAEQKAAEEVKQKAAQEEERKKRIAEYNGYVTSGDRFYKEKRYDDALRQYAAANQLFGGEQYPVKMINTIRGFKQQKQQAEEQYAGNVATASKLYEAAEAVSFNYASYKKALQAYEAAARIKPDDADVKQRIEEIKKKLSKYSLVNDKENGEDW